MAAIHREAIQKQIQQDWANREYIEVITGSIKKITDFLNSFGNLPLKLKLFSHETATKVICISFLSCNSVLLDMSCRSRIAVLNEKLTTLERRIEYLEACVSDLFFPFTLYKMISITESNLVSQLRTCNAAFLSRHRYIQCIFLSFVLNY